MRPLSERCHDHRGNIGPGQRHQIRRQKTVDNEYAASWDGLETCPLLPAESLDDIAAQIQDIIGTLPESLVFQRLELAIPTLEYPANDRFGGQ